MSSDKVYNLIYNTYEGAPGCTPNSSGNGGNTPQPPLPPNPGVASNIFYRDTVTISTGNLASKSFILSRLPINPSAVILVPDGGPIQIFNIDFYIDGRYVKWDNRHLDSLIEKDDVFMIFYQA